MSVAQALLLLRHVANLAINDQAVAASTAPLSEEELFWGDRPRPVAGTMEHVEHTRSGQFRSRLS
jgi:hypothetical protein